jgi:hypothetical protein
VKLYVDLETLQLIEGPGFRNPTSSLRFKRGDAAQIEVTFLAGGTTPVAIGDPLNLEIQFGIKPRNRYDIGYLVRSANWIMPTTEPHIYRCSPSFNTIELNSALGVGSATGSELAEITLMGEITWREGSAEPTSTRTFLVVVENDVNRGTEGVPTSAEPPYPAPENIVTTAAITVALANHSNAADPHPNYLRHDEQESLSPEEQANVRAAINAPEAPPYLNLPMQSIDGVWHVSVLDYQPSNSSDAMTGGTPGWRGRIACYNELSWICIKDDMTEANDGWRKLWYTILGPPQVTVVLINSYESLTSFGMLEAGMNYRVRFDNFDSVPNGGIFGITYVSNGSASVSNVQLVDYAFISASISNTADFTAELTEEPTSASDIFTEFTFTADSSFDWAGYSIFGYYTSGLEVSFTVTITTLP